MVQAEVTYIPARDADGAILGVVVRVHNIQKLKEREDQLRHSVALLEKKSLDQERFVHMVSHDLREPINTIINFSSLLQEELTGSPQAYSEGYLRRIRDGGERLRSLFDDLLEFVRLEKNSDEFRSVCLDRVMSQVRDDLGLACSRVGGRVEWDDLPDVAGDESLLRIVLQNLVSNALKFSREGVPPVVQVSSTRSGNWREISVQDNGIGIPGDQLDNVFGLFKRLHSRKEYDGTGLGLSICRRIAELHSGRISVFSDPGQGSRFSLFLPVAPLPELTGRADATH